MSNSLHLWPEPPRRTGGTVVAECRVEGATPFPFRLWYRFEEAAEPWLSRRADAWMLSAVFAAMQLGTTLVVHGPVSPSLLANLDLFQRFWSRWLPEVYRRVDLAAESVDDAAPTGTAALLAFSGGVDSCFSAYRGARGRGARARPAAGLTVQGFDVPAADDAHFGGVREKAARLLMSVGLEPLTVATNVRALPGDWNHVHGAATAAALHWFSGRFGAGVIASTLTFDRIARPYGTQLLTDQLLGSLHFPILNDGADVARIDKVTAIAAWPEAMEALRVCWIGPRYDRNCGVCEKCVRTKLEFLVNGLDLPAALPGTPTAAQIDAWPIQRDWQVRGIGALIDRAAANGLTAAPWFAPLVAKQRRLRRAARRRSLIQAASRLLPWPGHAKTRR